MTLYRVLTVNQHTIFPLCIVCTRNKIVQLNENICKMYLMFYIYCKEKKQCPLTDDSTVDLRNCKCLDWKELYIIPKSKATKA